MTKKRTPKKRPLTHLEKQKQKIDELCSLVARREAEILAMAKTDDWQHKRIEQLEAIVESLETEQDNTDKHTLARIKRLEADLAKANSTRERDCQELREQLLSYQRHNERLTEQNRSALEFIRTHCFNT